MSPQSIGTKAAARYHRTVPEGATIRLQLRLALSRTTCARRVRFADFEASLKQRKEEADEFYDVVLPPQLSDDARMIARQSFAGMLWSKQYYHYVVTDWLNGDPTEPEPPPERLEGRNHDWPISLPATCSPCRISGSSRGSRRGTWDFTASLSPTSIRSSQRINSSCCCANGTCTPMDKCPHTNGISAA